MIRDAYLNKDLSDFGEDLFYITNSFFTTREPIKKKEEEDLEEEFLSYTEKGLYKIDKELFVDNSYPYQVLLFKFIEKEDISQGYIIDHKKNHSCLITTVENYIPIKTVTITAQDEEELNRKIEGFFLSQETIEEQIFEIDEQDYSTKSFCTPFLPEGDLYNLLKKKRYTTLLFPITSLIFIASLIINVPPFIKYKLLSEKVSQLQQKKTVLESKIKNIRQYGLPIFKLQKEIKQRDCFTKQIAKVLSYFPTAKLLSFKGNTLIIETYPLPSSQELKKFEKETNMKAAYTPEGNISITISL